jgi:succinate dehydrogenase / fumarate reductase flavoprotein subunit
MGGLWVDYNLMSTIPGLHVLGEANFSDHGANRLGASALMQGLADGYFVIPATIGSYFAGHKLEPVSADGSEFRQAEQDVSDRLSKLMAVDGRQTVDEFHRELGLLLWEHCGMSRNETGLKMAQQKIPEIRERFWDNVTIPGSGDDLNQTLEKAGRVADFLEFAETMVADALARNESCGSHFREECQTAEGEALRNDEEYSHTSVWEFAGVGEPPKERREPLEFVDVHPSQRSYK